MLRPSVIFIVLALSSLNAESLSEPRDYWFQFNPGVRLHRTTMQVNGHGSLGLMTHSAVADWSLDVQSPDFVMKQERTWTAGVYLLMRSGPIHLNRQMFTTGTGWLDTDMRTFPENFLLSNGLQIENTSTRMDGYYAYAVPAFYIERKEWNGVRIGAGIGPSYVQLGGTLEMIDSSTPYSFSNTANTKTKEEALRLIAYYHLNTGLIGSNTDQVRRAMLMQLDAPGMLENYGAYALMKKWGTLRTDIYSLLALSQLNKFFPYPLTPLETYGLLSLTRTNIEIKQSAAPAVMFFVEMPLSDLFTTRVIFGGPFFYYQGYQYNLRTFELVVSIPLRY